MREIELTDAAIAWLRQALPESWSIERSRTQYGGRGHAPFQPESMIDIRSPNGALALLVDARDQFSPRDAERLLSGVAQALRGISRTELLVVSAWLSARTQGLLRAQAVNYLDLTGNAYIQTTYPAIFVSSAGASKNPAPAPRDRARVRGHKAGRLIRTLLDVRPPYTVGELAAATGLTPGYVSRLLSSLEYELLIDRKQRTGAVKSVALAPLLRRWTANYDVIKSNEPIRYLAPAGPSSAFEQLARVTPAAAVAVTGSFAAMRLAPVAAPALLIAYVRDLTAVQNSVNLLPAQAGANVLLLRPYDKVAFTRTTTVAGVTYSSVPQVAADCLTGPGRMPEEGEALLEWMGANDGWQAESLAASTAT